MNDNIFAYTALGLGYPGYVSINRLENGDVSVTVREQGTGPHEGVRVCRNRSDASSMDCYPSGPNCNNYCNLAPEKGEMKNSPDKVNYFKEGRTSQFTIPKEMWTLVKNDQMA